MDRMGFTATMDRAQLGDWLRWWGRMRLWTVTFLVAMVIALRQLTTVSIELKYFVPIIVCWYSLGIALLILDYWIPDLPGFHFLQIAADLLMVAGLVYATGGHESYFASLFLLVILLASVIFPERGVYIVAGASFILLAGTVELIFYGWIPRTASALPTASALQFWILFNLAAMLGVAYLGNSLAQSLRRKRAEVDEKSAEIRDLKSLTEDILQSMRGGLMLVGTDGCIQIVNRAGAEILGFTVRELENRSLREILPQLPPGYAVAESGAAAPRAEIIVPTPEGGPRFLGFTSSPLRTRADGAAGFVLNFQDLTSLKRLEREVALKDRMAAVGRLSAGIAHEIRQPLTAMAGALKELSRFAPLDDDDRRLVSIVIRESQRLNQIIDEFLDYAREKMLDFAEEDLTALLDETLVLVERASENCRIVRKYPARPVRARVDRNRFRQVVWNLCNNAFRAMPEGGTLTVALEADAKWARLRISDTGIGLDPRSDARIFEPFQSGFPRGVGLGLAIVYQIVQAHSGRVRAVAKNSSGAEFIVELPRVLPRPAAIPSSQREPARVALTG